VVLAAPRFVSRGQNERAGVRRFVRGRLAVGLGEPRTGGQVARRTGAGKVTLKFIKTTFIAGVLVLVPLAFIGYLTVSLFMTTRDIVGPVVNILPIDGVLVWIAVNLLAVLAVLLICFLAGLMVRVSFIATYFDRLDSLMSNRVPGYALAKGIVGDVVNQNDVVESHVPVFVTMAGGSRLGFEVERTDDGRVVVFLPNAPSAQSGFVMVFAADHVRPANIQRLKAVDLMQFHGMGMGKLLVAAEAEEQTGENKPAEG
jgi:uncharacterized membrane protein